MLERLVLTAVCLAAGLVATPAAQFDLDALMSRVLERRDQNWKKLQQYTLNEQETLQVTALGGLRLYGFQREYLWFPRAGFFIRSPLRADGVAISEEERRRAEDRWLRHAQNRETRPRRPRHADDANRTGADTVTGGVEDIVRQSFEPQFIESANFLRFKFDSGQYALVSRERLLERDVLKVEYYPKLLFRDVRDGRPQRGRPDQRDKEEEFEEDFENKMNKVSLVTLWVDPAEHQILQYEFRNIDLDFLPARSIVRVDGLRASMRMGEPFPEVWLPSSINIGFRMRLAVGTVAAKYEVKYRDYRLPTVTGRVR